MSPDLQTDPPHGPEVYARFLGYPVAVKKKGDDWEFGILIAVQADAFTLLGRLPSGRKGSFHISYDEVKTLYNVNPVIS